MSTGIKLDGKRKRAENDQEDKEESGNTSVPAFLLKIYDILKVMP